MSLNYRSDGVVHTAFFPPLSVVPFFTPTRGSFRPRICDASNYLIRANVNVAQISAIVFSSQSEILLSSDLHGLNSSSSFLSSFFPPPPLWPPLWPPPPPPPPLWPPPSRLFRHFPREARPNQLIRAFWLSSRQREFSPNLYLRFQL